MFVSSRDAPDGVQALPNIISPALHTPGLKDGTSESLTGKGKLSLLTPEPRFQGDFHDPSALAPPCYGLSVGSATSLAPSHH